MRLPRAVRAFRHASFRIIWASYLVSQAGFWVSNVSLQLLVVHLSGGNAFQQGLLGFFNFIPNLLLSPIAGVLADRYDRRIVIVAAQVGLGTIAALLAIMALTGLTSLYLIYVLALGLGVALATGGPVGSAIVANAVPARDLPSAVSLQSVALNLSRVVGPAIAVPIILVGGPQAAFGVYALLAFSTAVMLSRVRLPSRQRIAEQARWWIHLRRGFEHVAQRPPAPTVLSMVAVGGLFASSYSTLVPVFGVTVLHLPNTGFFALVVAMGIGAVIGAFLTGLAHGGTRITHSAIQMVALGVVLSLIGLTHEYWIALMLSALIGALLFALMATLATSLQLLIDDRNRGRVMALYVLCWGGLVPIGSLLLGVLAGAWGPGRAILLFGLITAGYGAVIGLRNRGVGGAGTKFGIMETRASLE
jgi:MFS family permease